jgi:shikimate kinase
VSGDAPQPTRLLLMGMMGSGKTTVGHAVAASTGWPYLDNDELVRRTSGIDTRAVLDVRGVDELRAMESRALQAALELAPPLIASVAGGVVDVPADLELLTNATGAYVVWLRARIDTLVERVGSGEDRPWLQPDPRTALERLYEGRAARYEQAATLIVDVDDLQPVEIAARIVDGMRAATTS